VTSFVFFVAAAVVWIAPRARSSADTSAAH
jgi:hypothetical protein